MLSLNLLNRNMRAHVPSRGKLISTNVMPKNPFNRCKAIVIPKQTRFRTNQLKVTMTDLTYIEYDIYIMTKSIVLFFLFSSTLNWYYYKHIRDDNKK